MAGTVKDVSLTLSFKDDGSVQVRRATTVVKKELATLGQEAAKSGAGFDKLKNRVEKSNKGMNKFKKMLKSTWVQMAAGMGVMMGIQGAIRLISRTISSAIKTGRDFEREWANTTTMMDLSTEAMTKMRDELLGLSPVLGDTTDLAKGMYQVLSASIAPSKAIMFVGEAAKAAQAGVTDTTTAVDALTTVLNAYGMEAEEVTRVSDMMFATVKRGKLTYEGMAGALGTVAPIAAQLGIRFEEIAAAMATLTRQGIDVNTTTVQLRQVMVSVLKPTTQAQDRAQKLGIRFDSLTLKAMGLAKFIKYVTSAVKDDTDALTDLFGNVRALTGIMGLGGLRAKDYAYDLKFVGKQVAYTEQAFKKQMATSDFWMRSFQNVMKKVKIAFWQGLTSPLKQGIKDSKDFQKKFEDFSRNLIEKAVKVGRSIAGAIAWVRSMKKEIILTVKIFVALWAVNKVYMWIAAIKSATIALGAMKMAMGGMALAVGVAYGAWKGLIWIRDKWLRGEGSVHKELKGTEALLRDLSKGLHYWGGILNKSVDEMKAQGIKFKERSELLKELEAAWEGYGQSTVKTLEMIIKGEHGEKLKKVIMGIAGSQGKMIESAIGAGASTKELKEFIDDLTKSLVDNINNGLDPMAGSLDDGANSANAITKALKEFQKQVEELIFSQRAQMGMTEAEGNALKKLYRSINNASGATDFWIGANEKLTRSMWGILTINEKLKLSQDELVAEGQKAGESVYWLPTSQQVAERMREIADEIENGTRELETPWEKLLGKITNTVSKIAGAWDNMHNQIYQNQMMRIENEYQRRKDIIDASMKSDEEKYFAIETLDREMEKRRLAAMRKHAAAQKVSNLAMAAMNVAVAVTEALPNLVLATIIGLLGAIQVASIAAQPLPSFEKGGIAGWSGEEIIRVGERGPERITPLVDEHRARREQREEVDRANESDQKTFRLYLTTIVGGKKFEDVVVKTVNTRGDDIVIKNTSVI